MAAPGSVFQGSRELLSAEFDGESPTSNHFTGKSSIKDSAALKVEIFVPASEVSHCGESDPIITMGRD